MIDSPIQIELGHNRLGNFMKRRELLVSLGGTVPRGRCPCAQPSQMRRVGVLFVLGEDHPEVPSLVAAIKERLRSLGWIEGRTIQIDFRFCRGDPERVKRYSEELVGAQPDVILAQGIVGAAAMKQATTSIPVVSLKSRIRSAVDCQERGASGGRSHRLHELRLLDREQVAAAAEGCRPGHHTGDAHDQSRQSSALERLPAAFEKYAPFWE